MMCSWCETPTLEKQSEMKFPKFAEMHNDQQPTCSQNCRDPCKQQWKDKSEYNSCVAWNQSQQTRTRGNQHKNKHIQPSKNTLMRKHNASNPESGVRMTQPIVLGETIWETASANTQIKTQWHKNYFAKRWRTEPSHAQLAFHRDHTCIRDTKKQRTTNRRTPNASHWKTKCPKWSILTFDSQKNTHLWPLNSDVIEVLKNRLTRSHMKKQPCSTTTTLIQMTRKPSPSWHTEIFTFPATLWHLGDVHNHQTIKPQHNAVFSELHNFLHL